MPAAVPQAFLAQSYALCMLILALNYLAAQLLMEFAQSANEFKARLTIQRANRIFVNVHENIPLHVAFLTGAMVITTGSGHETGLAYAIILYTAARTAWLACYKGAPTAISAVRLLSMLYGACLYTPCAPYLRAPYASLLALRGAQSRCAPAQARRCSPCSPVCSSRLVLPSQGRRRPSVTRTERGETRCSNTGHRNGNAHACRTC